MYPIKRSKPKNLKKQKPSKIKHSPSPAGSSSNISRKFSPHHFLKEYDKRIA